MFNCMFVEIPYHWYLKVLAKFVRYFLVSSYRSKFDTNCYLYVLILSE